MPQKSYRSVSSPEDYNLEVFGVQTADESDTLGQKEEEEEEDRGHRLCRTV